MKILKKTLAVGLSLALCASMVAPAFAASFDELQNVIDTQTSLRDENDAFRIEYDDGNVKLYEDVTRGENEAGKSITINEGNVTIDLNGNNIDGDGKSGSVITVTGEDTSLTLKDTSEEKDGKVTGGNGGQGGGVIVTGGASATLESGNISENKATTNGGGVYVDNGTFTMNGGKISDNDGGNAGGGVFVNTTKAEMSGDEARFVMTGGEISGNEATSGGGVGAYSRVENDNSGEDGYAAVDISGGKITGNTATTGDGGGVAAQHNTVKIDKAEISGNTAGNGGGGIWLSNSSTTITNSKVTENGVTSTKPESGGGGGIYAGGGTVNISGTEISGNHSELNGGGISVNGTMTLNNVTVTDNHADSGRGGGIYAGNNGNVSVLNGEISKNSAMLGGGMFAFSNPVAGQIMKVTVEGAEITNNEASKFGGGIYVYNGAEFTINSGSVSSNTAANGGGVFARAAKFTMTGGALYGNTGTSHSADLYSDNNSSVTLVDISGLGLKLGDTPITGWLWDGNPRWNAESDGNHKYPSFTNYTGNLYLKAAHDKYYNVSYMDGETVLQTGKWEKGEDIPVYEQTLTRPGYTFGGWLVGGEEFDPTDGTVGSDLVLVALWIQNPTPVDPVDPGIEVEDPDVPLGGEPEVEINDPAVPLASGPVTRAQFVDYLWRHEGEPAPVADSGLFEDVTEEHEYSPAMAWAKSIGIIEAYEDGTFEPDELVTVAAVRGILTKFAAYADMAMPELTTLTGGDDEAVLNCSQVLAEFFGEEYEIPEIDDAA